MSKLQHISLATTALILGCNSIGLSNINASTIISQQKPITLSQSQNKIATSYFENSISHSTTAIKQYELAQQLAANQTPDRDDEVIDALQQRQEKQESLKELNKFKENKIDERSSTSDSSEISSPLAFKMLTIGLPATVLVFLIATPFVKGITRVFKSNYQAKYGKPKVPEGSISLHHRSFQEITSIGNKAENINNDKFGSEEFLLLLRIKINIFKEAEGYKGLGNCVELLQAAIIAQKSFLRLEQTELRYRSRKQQEFYQYVTDNLASDHDIDQEAFTEKVNQKQVEVLSLINLD